MSFSTAELKKLLELEEEEEETLQEEPKKKKGKRKEEDEEEELKFIQARYAGVAPWNESPPKAFVPPDPAPYPADVQDAFIPRSGFVSDFVYSLKGRESPPIFNIFGALFTLSSIAARKSWFVWADEVVYPNLYVLWVAPPAICKKGTAIGRAIKLIQLLPTMVADDPVMFDEKSIELVTSKATGEGLYIALAKKEKHYILPNGTFHHEDFGSRAIIAAPEFVTFMNNKKYNV